MNTPPLPPDSYRVPPDLPPTGTDYPQLLRSSIAVYSPWGKHQSMPQGIPPMGYSRCTADASHLVAGPGTQTDVTFNAQADFDLQTAAED